MLCFLGALKENMLLIHSGNTTQLIFLWCFEQKQNSIQILDKIILSYKKNSKYKGNKADKYLPLILSEKLIQNLNTETKYN